MKDFTNRTEKTNERLRYDIEKWLDKEGKDNHCPFGQEIKIGEDCVNLCEQVFPRLDVVAQGVQKVGISYLSTMAPTVVAHEIEWCPCNNYSLKYVIRVAKQAIKALE